MSKKKGLSVEEKRKVILGIYHVQKEPFNLKEMEAIGSRMGVVQQTIKDINQSLVDDFLVNSDKIGSSNFFWSFPSKHGNDLKRKRDSMLDSAQSSESLDKKLEDAMRTRSHPDRKAKMQRLRSLLEEDKELEVMIQNNKENDPAELQRILKQVAINKESVNRWTDNIWACKKFLTKSKGISSKEADKFLRIGAGFDYV